MPQIRTREIESVMRVNSGEIAVLGRLMEDGVNWKMTSANSRADPAGRRIVLTRNNAANKSELVISCVR